MSKWYTIAMNFLIRLEADSSRTGKEEIIKESLQFEFMRRIYVHAYDQFILFGILPGYVARKDDGSHFGDPSEEQFFNVLRHLRQGTLANPRDFISQCMTQWAPEAAELLWRVLNKDLRCGISVKTLNNVSPGMIFAFSPMLCHPFQSKRVRRWPVTCEWKYDGLRTVVRVTNSLNDLEVEFLSRTGRQKFATMPELTREIKLLVEGLERSGFNPPVICFDGELTRGVNFNDSSSIKSYTQVLNDVTLTVFEALRPEELAGAIQIPWSERQERLQRGIDCSHALQWVKRSFGPLSYVAHNEDEIRSYFAIVREQGGEGIIVKQGDGGYYPKRGYEWMKLKGVQTIDLEVCAAYEGEGKYAGQLGGFVVRDATGREVCRVGGGFSDDQRKEWGNDEYFAANILGQIAEIEYQDFTPDGSLRNPQFLRLRDDKTHPDMASPARS